MNTDQFLADYKKAKERSQLTQKQVSVQFKVHQTSLSRFERRKNMLSFENALKLWPFVYGHELEEKNSPIP